MRRSFTSSSSAAFSRARSGDHLSGGPQQAQGVEGVEQKEDGRRVGNQ